MISERYGVIVCSRCGVPKIADLCCRTTRCSGCGRSLVLARMRLHGVADFPADLIPVVGALNRSRTTVPAIFDDRDQTAPTPFPPVGPRVSPRIDPADPDPCPTSTDGDDDRSGRKDHSSPEPATPREPPPPRDPLDPIRSFMRETGEFTLPEFEDAVVRSGRTRERAATLLRSFLDHGEVYSPRRGFFRYIPEEP